MSASAPGAELTLSRRTIATVTSYEVQVDDVFADRAEQLLARADSQGAPS